MHVTQQIDDTYLKMCYQAKELKDYWSPEFGDRFYLCYDLYQKHTGGRLTTIKYLHGAIMKYHRGLYIFDPNDNNKGFLKFAFPIPYQEQIQEKLLKRVPVITLLTNFMNFAVRQGSKYSIEALWLMYYYDVTHNKEWVDGDWTNIKEAKHERFLYRY